MSEIYRKPVKHEWTPEIDKIDWLSESLTVWLSELLTDWLAYLLSGWLTVSIAIMVSDV